MATERFPNRKYIRQLSAMYMELQAWQAEYHRGTLEHQDDWLGSRFAARAGFVDRALTQVTELRATLYELPRLS